MKRSWLTALVLAPLACRAGGDGRPSDGGTVVDSVLPMEVMLARFRDGLPRPTTLHGDSDSRDALVREVITALEASDTAAFARLAVDRGEWAWLYFPGNVLSRSPYELPPGLAWFQLQETNRQGVFRALREFGGRRLDYRGYRCNPEPTTEGANRLWIGCTVTIGRDSTPPVPIRLFSAILERGDRFLILSYANDF